MSDVIMSDLFYAGRFFLQAYLHSKYNVNRNTRLSSRSDGQVLAVSGEAQTV